MKSITISATLENNEREITLYDGTDRFTAYGTYESRDVYELNHAPTDRDFDEIALALDEIETEITVEK